jgi:hypothetical protein
MQEKDEEVLEVVRSPCTDYEKSMVVSALLREMEPETHSVRVFSRFGHWNQEDGSLEGQPDWDSISDILHRELQACLDRAAIHAGLEESALSDLNGTAPLDEQLHEEDSALEILEIVKSPVMDSEKTSCLAALLPSMSLDARMQSLLADLGCWNSSEECFDGTPNWDALAKAIETPAALADGSSAALAALEPCSSAHGAWMAKLERVAMGTD